jgi:hypothetical protein
MRWGRIGERLVKSVRALRTWMLKNASKWLGSYTIHEVLKRNIVSRYTYFCIFCSCWYFWITVRIWVNNQHSCRQCFHVPRQLHAPWLSVLYTVILYLYRDIVFVLYTGFLCQRAGYTTMLFRWCDFADWVAGTCIIVFNLLHPVKSIC